MCNMSDDARKMKLGDLAHIRAGHPFRGAVEAVPEGAVAVAQMKDILPGGGVDWSSAVRTELVGRKEPDWLNVGDLLFVSRGSRYFAVCVDLPPAPAVCGPHLFHLTVRDADLLMPEFLAWVVGQGPVQRQLQQAASGSLQLSVTRQGLEALEIPLPPLATQRVVTDLAAAAARERVVLTALIQNRERQLEALASALASGQPTNLT
jgi:hypothetical protein